MYGFEVDVHAIFSDNERIFIAKECSGDELLPSFRKVKIETISWFPCGIQECGVAMRDEYRNGWHTSGVMIANKNAKSNYDSFHIFNFNIEAERERETN